MPRTGNLLIPAPPRSPDEHLETLLSRADAGALRARWFERRQNELAEEVVQPAIERAVAFAVVVQ
jgi:hypothetical protein